MHRNSLLRHLHQCHSRLFNVEHEHTCDLDRLKYNAQRINASGRRLHSTNDGTVCICAPFDILFPKHFWFCKESAAKRGILLYKDYVILCSNYLCYKLQVAKSGMWIGLWQPFPTPPKYDQAYYSWGWIMNINNEVNTSTSPILRFIYSSTWPAAKEAVSARRLLYTLMKAATRGWTRLHCPHSALFMLAWRTMAKVFFAVTLV